MRASARFLAEIRKSHTLFEYVDIVNNAHQTKRLHVTMGNVNADRTSQFRRSVSLVCIDPDGTFIPNGPGGDLTPYGTHILPYSGVMYSDGTTEVYPLGVFRLSDCTVDESNPLQGAGTTLTLEGYDASRTISRDKFINAYTIAQGTLVTSALQYLVRRTLPNATFDMITHGMTVPYQLTYAVGDDPWQACTDLAQSIGCETYFDVAGNCVIAPPADVTALGSPDFDYIEGQGCTMTDLAASYSDSGYNGVIVVGASTGTAGAAVQGAAWDMDPASPTYRYGPYGQVPEIVQDQNITTVADANNSAASILNGQLGFLTQADVTCWTNPAIDVNDVIQVERSVTKTTGRFVVDSLTIPMGSSNTGTPASYTEQTVTLRQVRAVGS